MPRAGAFLRQAGEPAANAAPTPLQHRRVDHRRADVGLAPQIQRHAHGAAAIVRIGGERKPPPARGRWLVDAGGDERVLHCAIAPFPPGDDASPRRCADGASNFAKRKHTASSRMCLPSASFASTSGRWTLDLPIRRSTSEPVSAAAGTRVAQRLLPAAASSLDSWCPTQISFRPEPKSFTPTGESHPGALHCRTPEPRAGRSPRPSAATRVEPLREKTIGKRCRCLARPISSN